jgi:protein-tyrosine kinase
MVDYILRRNRRDRLEKDERSRLLERVARHAAEAEAQEKALRAALRGEAAPQQADLWSKLRDIPVNESLMDENLIITATRHDPAHATFDVLRTRLVQTLSDKGWRRVGITSPTRDCGKTFVSVNLAIALSRYENCRTVLMDMDMRNPSVAPVLGLNNVGSMGAFLRGDRSIEDTFCRFEENKLKIGRQLALGLNDKIEPYAAELLQKPETTARIEEIEEKLDANIVLYDLPPALAQDDVIAFSRMYDGVFIVAGGGTTTALEVREVMRRLGDDVPLLGVILNRAEGQMTEEYGY